MRACLQTFLAGIEELKGYLTAADHESTLVGLLLRRQASLPPEESSLLAEIAKTRTARKRYIYTVAIVSLYGLLERFVDSLIERFVQRIAGLASSYDKVPEVIRKHHVQFSVELVKALVDDRFRGEATQEEVIGNLHSCLSGAAEFRVNGAAFVLHRGNISLGRVTNFLASIGIISHLRKATLTAAFADFVARKDPERSLDRLPDQELERLFEPIDDLVERRNSVSHGVISVDDIESIDLLQERCDFVAAYGSALYEIALQEVLQHELTGPQVQELGLPIAVFGNSIVCFEHGSCRIAVGDILVAATGDELVPFRYGPIASIEINKTRHPEINLSQPTQFGVAVPYKARENFRYYALAPGRAQ